MIDKVVEFYMFWTFFLFFLYISLENMNLICFGFFFFPLSFMGLTNHIKKINKG